MQHIRTKRLIRITRQRAKKVWGHKTISLCPSNLVPDIGNPKPNIDVIAREAVNMPFEKVVKDFENNYCIDYKTGYYVAFYMERETHKEFKWKLRKNF